MQDYTDIAKRVLRFESEQVAQAMGRLNAQFNEAVACILGHEGKVVVCGIGKSGAIAEKITATLCSTGTQAVFLHAGEASHGDLGVYHKGDPVLFVSKSGTTEEMIRLMPFFRENNSRIIAITGNLQTPLARKADIVIDASVEREADSMDLAPTASTTVALALGDALAVALMEARGFTEKDFARFHPGGQLGKNLTLRVADVMHHMDAVAKVTEDSSFRDLIIAMTEQNLGAACVLGKNGSLAGLITDGDVRRSMLKNTDLQSLHVRDIMTPNPVSIDPDSSLKEAADRMERRSSQLSVLPVVQGNICVGLIRIHDIY